MPTPVKVLLVLLAIAAVVAVLVLVLLRRMRAAGVYVYRTMFGLALVLPIEDDEGNTVRVLNVGGMFQSATYLDERRYEPVFDYYKLFDHIFEANRPMEHVLMIGGGGYAYPKHFVSSRPQGCIDVVEIDPKITQIAYEHFFLDRLVAEFDTETTGRLNLFAEDGRVFLDELAAAPEGMRYDAILIDTFKGKDPVPSLSTVEAMAAVRGCLAPDGVFMANVVSELEGEGARFMQQLVAALDASFAHVYVIPCGHDEAFGDCDNNMVVATNANHTFSDVYPFERDPSVEPLREEAYAERLKHADRA